MLSSQDLLTIHLELLLIVRHSILLILRCILGKILDVLPYELGLWLSKVQNIMILVMAHWRTFLNVLPRLVGLIVQGSKTMQHRVSVLVLLYRC